jgi:hypothetical protein
MKLKEKNPKLKILISCGGLFRGQKTILSINYLKFL